MCSNRECPRRAECYRYRAVPDDRYQRWAEFDHERCEWFIYIGDRRVVPLEVADERNK